MAPSTPTSLPFTEGPSRIVLHTDPNQPTNTPQAALLLSLDLTQKLHSLITTSRQIETLAQNLIIGASPSVIATQMTTLEETHSTLREEIEDEFENAFIGAGFIAPADPQPTPPSTQVATTVSIPVRQPSKLERKEYSVDSEEWERRVSYTPTPQPIGTPLAMMQNTQDQEERMRAWTWEWGVRENAKRKRRLSVKEVEDEDDAVSPRTCKRRKREEDGFGV